MRSTCLVFITVLVIIVKADDRVWLKDLISSKGWDLGYGLVLKLNETNKEKDAPLIERLSLDVNLGDLLGVSVGKSKSDGVELDFYVKKDVDYQGEGRSKKDEDGKHMIPMIVGYKAAIFLAGTLGLLKLVALKALFAAKAALIISFFVLLLKLKEPHGPEIIEVEQHGYPSHHVPIHFPAGAPSFHVYSSGGFGGGGGGAGGGGGGGASYGSNYGGKEAQSSNNVYQEVVYQPSAAGSAIEETNSPYVGGGHGNEPPGMGRIMERKRDTYLQKMLSNGGGGGLITLKKYATPES